ncbi:MAG: carbohydrate kinase [Clostridia bacterium]|nr:carbohydrate kinase [Clostridia bacterium]
MSRQFDLTALGELLIDFTPAGKSAKGMELFERNPGGAPANVLAAYNKLGGNTAFIGKVGDDAFGHFLADTVNSYGINTDNLLFDPEIPTTLAFVTLDGKGDRSFSFYRKPGADIMLRKDEVSKELLENTDIFHFGSVSMTDDPAWSATFFAADYARRNGAITSYDPNYRPLLWKDESDAVIRMTEGLEYGDIVKVSDEEMTLMTGKTDIDAGAEKILRYGADIVYVSMGAKGSFCATKKHSVRLETYDVKTIDTTGAGDAFLGAILHRLHGKTRDDIADISLEEMTDILDYANAAGSVTTTRTGAAVAVPTEEEIEECRRTVPKLKI